MREGSALLFSLNGAPVAPWPVALSQRSQVFSLALNSTRWADVGYHESLLYHTVRLRHPRPSLSQTSSLSFQRCLVQSEAKARLRHIASQALLRKPPCDPHTPKGCGSSITLPNSPYQRMPFHPVTHLGDPDPTTPLRASFPSESSHS